MKPTFEIKARKDFSQGDVDYVENWLRRLFGGEADALVWSEPDWHILACMDNELVSHVQIHERTILVGGQPLRISGISAVATVPECRGFGFASKAMRLAGEFIKNVLLTDFGLLFCDGSLQAFYHRLGWIAVDAPCFFEQPTGRVQEMGAVMILACSTHEWPRGDIDLCGYPW